MKPWCTCRNEYETCGVCLGTSGLEDTQLVDTKAIPHPITDEPRGYHVAVIPRGTYGQSSKILEEVLELQDAEKQGAAIMGLHELSDIVGAVHGYLREHYPTMKFEDLLTMSRITRRAFESGQRK